MELLHKKLMMGLFLFGVSLWPAALFIPKVAAYDSPEGAVMEDELRRAALYHEQQQKEAARLQQQFQRNQRVAKELEVLIAKAGSQHAKIRQWEMKHTRGLQTQTKVQQSKKRVQVAITLPR